ncbi:MAG: hypothetical protein PHE25_02805 [Candidatus Gracilibacteria bacterium]|nr:hypothetical protein [Candidatus Gracilibacteria bacterium]
MYTGPDRRVDPTTRSVFSYAHNCNITLINGRNCILELNGRPIKVNPEVANYLFQGQRRFVKVRKRTGEIIKINGIDLKFTKFDFKEIGNYSDDELRLLILADTGIDLFENEKSGLRSINELFKRANNDENLGIIADILIKSEIPKLPGRFHFATIGELFEFMRTAGNSSPESRMKCIMLKVVSGVSDVMRTPGLELLDEKLETLLFNLKAVLGLRNLGDASIGTISGKKIEVFGRAKTLASLLGKTLGDPEYDKISRAKDSVGLTFELQEGTKEDYLDLFSEVLNGCKSLGGDLVEIKGKGFKKEEIQEYIESNDNLTGIIGVNNIKTEKKSGTSKGYIDLKFSIRFGNTVIEIKITPPENKNQEGLNFSGIYAVLNRYIEGFIIRHLNDGYITGKELEMMAGIFFDNLQRLINENPEITGMSAEEFLYGIKSKDGKTDFKGLWEDMQGRGLIRADLKAKNIERQRKLFLEGLANYYKSMLKSVILDNGEMVWSNERGKELYGYS